MSEHQHSLEIDGQTVPVRLRRSVSARAMSLRLDPQDGAALLVLPSFVSAAQGLAFVCSKADWLRGRLAALPPRRLFHDGAVVPLLGAEHTLRHQPEARRGVWAEPGTINVSGRAEFFARRVADWLKTRALAEIIDRVGPMAERLAAQGKARPVGKIAVRDTVSRWGSCSSQGDLAFSWRLVMTPPEVLTYVVAHEVAHLAEMNHSEHFWRTVEDLAPGSKPLRAWLKLHGARLHRIG